MKHYFLLFTAFVIVSHLSSCRKEGCINPAAINFDQDAQKDDGTCIVYPEQAEEPDIFIPKFTGDHALLLNSAAYYSFSVPGQAFNDVIKSTSIGVFTVSGVKKNAGTITVNNYNVPQATDLLWYKLICGYPSGFNFDNANNWVATGSAWPAFTLTTDSLFPTISHKTSSSDIYPSSSYTLSATISDADSVLFVVAGVKGTAQHMVTGNSASYTFTSSELSSVGKGYSFVQIIGLKYTQQIVGGRTYHIVNERVRTEKVEIH